MTGHITLMMFQKTGIHTVYFERRTKRMRACVQGTSTVTSLDTGSFVKRVLKAHVAVSRETFIVAYLTCSFNV